MELHDIPSLRSGRVTRGPTEGDRRTDNRDRRLNDAGAAGVVVAVAVERTEKLLAAQELELE